MVRNLIKSGKEILFAQQASILSAAAIIAGTVLLSRILGLVKYRVFNSFFDVTQMGLFFAAFRLPNLIFDLIVMGALTTAFIPIFTSYLKNGSEEEADKMASTIINLAGIFFLILTTILLLASYPLVRLITPGLSNKELDVVVMLTRIMLVGQTLPLILGNFLTGIVQSHKRFLIPALAPVFYNLGIIVATWVLAPTLGIYAPAWGVVIGAILFLIIQIPICIKLGFHYSPTVNLSHPGVREVIKLVVPRIIGLSINQLNYTVNLALSSLIATRSIATFNYAQQLQQLPISIFGITIAQAALPTLSEENAKDDPEAFTKTFRHSLLQIAFLTLPAAAVLIILRIPIVRLVYGADKFDWPATVETGRTLAFFSLALVSEAMINLLVRAFFALKESRIPVFLGSITVIINIILSVIFIPILHFPVWGLAAAASAADIAYSIMLLLFLNKRLHLLNFSNLFFPMLKMVFAALLALFSMYAPLKLLDQLVFDTTRTVPLILLTGVAGTSGLLVYLFFTWLFKIDELNSFLGMFKKIKLVFQKKIPVPVAEVASPVTEEPNQGQHSGI